MAEEKIFTTPSGVKVTEAGQRVGGDVTAPTPQAPQTDVGADAFMEQLQQFVVGDGGIVSSDDTGVEKFAQATAAQRAAGEATRTGIEATFGEERESVDTCEEIGVELYDQLLLQVEDK